MHIKLSAYMDDHKGLPLQTTYLTCHLLILQQGTLPSLFLDFQIYDFKDSK